MASILAARNVAVVSRVTRFRPTWPVDGSSNHYDPPFTDTSGYPSLDAGTELTEILGYTVSADDDLGAATLELSYVNVDENADGIGDRTGFFQENDLVRIEEAWSDPSTGADTGWQVLGWFFVDGPIEGISPTDVVCSVRGRDVMKLLSLDTFSGRMGGDLINVTRKSLTVGGLQGNAYYRFSDGAWASNTLLWTVQPGPRLYKGTTGSEVIQIDGSNVQVVYGDGEVRIAKGYYEDDLGSSTIQCAYWRYAVDSDVVTHTVNTVSNGPPPTINVSPSPGWSTNQHQGKRLIIRTGNGIYQKYTVASNTADTLTLSTGSVPVTNGVAAADTFSVPDANRLEDRLREVVRDAGFQFKASGSPFYVNTVEAISPSVYLPPLYYDQDDDVRHFEVVRDIRRWAPANYQVYAGQNGQLYCKAVTEAAAADYTLDTLADVRKDPSDVQVYTSIRYLGRDRTPKNIAWVGNYDASLTVISAAGNVDQLGNQIVPPQNISGLGKTTLRRLDDTVVATIANRNLYLKNLVDENFETRLGWHFRADDTTTMQGALRDLDLFIIDLQASEEIEDIELVIWPLKGVHRGQTTTILFSDDNSYYEIMADNLPADGDFRVRLPRERMKITSARYVKVRCAEPDNWALRNSFGSDDNVEWWGAFEVKIWSRATFVGTAIYGQTSPFNATADKQRAARLRSRTFTVPEIDEYANTQAAVNTLALTWLREKYREFAPLRVRGIRPDAWVRDTVTVSVDHLNLASTNYYLKELRRSHQIGQPPEVDAVLVDYRI